ncbi:MAG: hypothetical protein DRQ55_09955, partial [Planctomycetota bacterium]
GGSAISLAADPSDPDALLLIQYIEGLFRSADGGETRTPYGSGLSTEVRELIHDPADPQSLYAYSPDNVFHSSDFGANWTTLALVPTEYIKDLAVSPVTGDLLVVEPWTVHRSTDGGANWGVAAAFVPYTGVVLGKVAYSHDASVAYVATFDGVMRSDDGGASFGAPNPSFTEWVQAIDVDPSDADIVLVGTPFNGIFRSTDGGVSFASVGGGVTAGNAEWFSRDPDGTLWYAVLNNLYASTDAGVSWSSVTGGWPLNTPIPLTMDYAPSGKRFLGCEGGGLYDKSGGGLYAMPAGAPSAWTHKGFLVSRIDDVAIAGPGGLRVIGFGAGVYAGVQGEPPTPTAWHADIGTATRAVAVDPTDSTRWVTGGVGAFQDNAQIAIVSNNGTSFVKTYEVYGAGAVTDIQFDPHFVDRVMAGMFPAGFGTAALTLSTDGGDTWNDVPGTAGWSTRAIAYDPHTPGRIMQLSDNNQWSESLNGGSVWMPLQAAWSGTGPGMLLVFDPFVPGRIYRGETGSGLWRSDDDGSTWSSLGVGLTYQSRLLCHADIPGLLWVSDDSAQILVSLDGGDNFSVALDVPLGQNGSAMAIDSGSGDMLIGTDGSSTWELPHGSPTVVLGGGSAGTGGIVPLFYPSGSLPTLGNPLFSLTGDKLVGGATVFLVLGITEVSAPAFGGVFHVGTIVEPIVAFGVGGTPGVAGAGSFTISTPIPNDPILSGLPVIAQLGVSDPGAIQPGGKVLSHALRMTIVD